MEPYAHLVSQLFSAARRANHWKELRSYYFHNCVYGRLYRTEGLRDPVRISDLFRECDGRRYKLIVVGDAAMAPYELMGDPWSALEEERVPGLEWLARLRRHFPRAIWLNPESDPTWGFATVSTIARVFPMYPLTLAGLEDGLQRLKMV
jgi:uncharacterized protein with von Willebrand factor type A (vWA) domain